MCGIVGYIGSKQASEVLLSGLKRLEYRGYDSAGVAIFEPGKPAHFFREKGKVAELVAKIDSSATGTVGIGHTRWATHGAPSEVNAHPHKVDSIYLVHNGIIENYKEIKAFLQGEGCTFASDTDTEVLAALIAYEYKRSENLSLFDAVVQSLDAVVGAYGIAVIDENNPDEIVVARKGSPLIIGQGDNEIFIASDASALLGYTDRVMYLRDGEIAICSREKGVELFDVARQKIHPSVKKLEMDAQAIQKKGYDHFLLKEIHEQSETVRSTLAGRLVMGDDFRVQLGGINMTQAELQAVDTVLVVGCGTAHYAGVLSSYIIEQFLSGVSVQSVVASELRYRSMHIPKNTVALIVSQSGETADTLACLEMLKERGIRCLGVVNAVGSTIAREVDGGVYVHVGAEISVASTKAFTSQVVAIVMFGIMMGQAKGVPQSSLRSYIEELSLLPEEIESVIEQVQPTIKQVASKYAHYEHALFIGRDSLFPIALEGALKLKEISYIQAEGYAAGELKHGPIALVDDRFFEVALVADNWLLEKTLSNINEVNARGGHVLAITNSDKEVEAETVIRIKTKLSALSPLVFNIVLQLFAYYVSVERGNDVDQPRNLAKSVTVE